MIGKVIEGRYAGASVHKLSDKNVFFVQTEDGRKVALSKSNAISIEDVSEQYPSYGNKVMMVVWNDYESSILQFELVKNDKPSSMTHKEEVSPREQHRGDMRVKRLTCEMCSSNDLVKQNGLFVCQHCGCKYSVEEARKMMIEGSVDVSGSVVHIDNSEQTKKYLLNARRAKDANDWKTAEKYYDLVIQNDPHNIEAVFYCIYSDVRIQLEERNPERLTKRIAALGASFNAIAKSYFAQKIEDNVMILADMSSAIEALDCNMWRAGQVENLNLSFYNTMYVFDEMERKFTDALEAIIQKDEQPDIYRILIVHYRNFIENNRITKANSARYITRLDEINRRMSTLDKAFRPQATPKTKGCYIATAVYGSYDCAEVWTLRRFRDYELAETWYGRAFIHTYYAISPTIVKWFGNAAWFKKMWKGTLDRMVSNLNQKGVADTPYKDREW